MLLIIRNIRLPLALGQLGLDECSLRVAKLDLLVALLHLRIGGGSTVVSRGPQVRVEHRKVTIHHVLAL